ncbi:MAG TPA: MgtC/SapB family protein [Halanaerobiales bacterium]|nr:MgtC/SapB family protein [Halanaerobiales bacterium]
MNIIWLDVIKLFLISIIAILIGYNRQKRNKPAGIKTNMIVGVISCLVMIISLKISNSEIGITNGADPARLGAQVISGIGFLGAGTILKNEDKIEGLTTAACLWGVAGLGLAVGYGLFSLSIISVIIIYIALSIK